MLKFIATDINICRVSKLLVKYNDIHASITDSEIIVDGNISDDLLFQLCNDININSVQNYLSDTQIDIKDPTNLKNEKENIQQELQKRTNLLLSENSDYDLLYPEVKRGEVYLCDFGEPYGCEQGLTRFAIIIQNDSGNKFSPTTIAIPTTTKSKKNLPTHIECVFSYKNMLDYNYARVGSIKNIILTEQIHTIDKRKLRKYIGKLSPELMKEIQDKIDISLGIQREPVEVVKEKNVFVDNPTSVSEKTNSHNSDTDLSLVQIQLLSNIDIKQLISITKNFSPIENKVQKILELFGFNFSQNGVKFLSEAIINSTKMSYFNLETLSELVSNNNNVDKNEVKRLIVARVKENFGFKKAPTLEFIRLINTFLV